MKSVEDLPRIIHEAFHIATTGRPGPVLIDIPKDVQFSKGVYQGPDEVKHQPQLRARASRATRPRSPRPSR